MLESKLDFLRERGAPSAHAVFVRVLFCAAEDAGEKSSVQDPAVVQIVAQLLGVEQKALEGESSVCCLEPRERCKLRAFEFE